MDTATQKSLLKQVETISFIFFNRMEEISTVNNFYRSRNPSHIVGLYPSIITLKDRHLRFFLIDNLAYFVASNTVCWVHFRLVNFSTRNCHSVSLEATLPIVVRLPESFVMIFNRPCSKILGEEQMVSNLV